MLPRYSKPLTARRKLEQFTIHVIHGEELKQAKNRNGKQKKVLVKVRVKWFVSSGFLQFVPFTIRSRFEQICMRTIEDAYVDRHQLQLHGLHWTQCGTSGYYEIHYVLIAYCVAPTATSEQHRTFLLRRRISLSFFYNFARMRSARMCASFGSMGLKRNKFSASLSHEHTYWQYNSVVSTADTKHRYESQSCFRRDWSRVETPSVQYIHFVFDPQILVTVCLACAVAQQQPLQSQQQQQQHHQQQQQQQHLDERISTTTWIPILSFSKEQGQDGSYRQA